MLSMPTATPSVSMSSPRGSVPSIHSNLMTIPSEIVPSEQAPSEWAASVENDRQRDNQGVHDHLGEIQNELRDLADYIHKEVPQPVQRPMRFKYRSIGGSTVLSFLELCGAPDYPSKPPTETGKASPIA